MAGGEGKHILGSMRNVSLRVDRSTLSGASGGSSRDGVGWGVVGPFSTKQETRAMAIHIKDNKLTIVDLIKVEQTLGDWIQNYICSVDIQLRGCVTAGR